MNYVESSEDTFQCKVNLKIESFILVSGNSFFQTTLFGTVLASLPRHTIFTRRVAIM